jgi:hypothetical protein
MMILRESHIPLLILIVEDNHGNGSSKISCNDISLYTDILLHLLSCFIYYAEIISGSYNKEMYYLNYFKRHLS